MISLNEFKIARAQMLAGQIQNPGRHYIFNGLPQWASHLLSRGIMLSDECWVNTLNREELRNCKGIVV